MNDEAITIDTINKWIRIRPRLVDTTEQMVGLEEQLRQFVSQNEKVSTSPNYHSEDLDDMSCMAHLLGDQAVRGNDSVVLLLLKIFKILLRKEINRESMETNCVTAVVHVLRQPNNTDVAKEASNVVLNMCYEQESVDSLIEQDGVKFLVGFLFSNDDELLASASGAIQSICYQDYGRVHIRKLGAIEPLIDLLSSSHLKVQTRVVGALHNMSSDTPAIHQIRQAQGIRPLCEMLKAPNPTVCGSAAGAIQNLSREPASRKIIKEIGVGALTDLLMGSDVNAQVCAAGALLNIMGPDMEANDETRVAFKELLSDSIALGMVYNSVYDFESRATINAPGPALGENLPKTLCACCKSSV